MSSNFVQLREESSVTRCSQNYAFMYSTMDSKKAVKKGLFWKGFSRGFCEQGQVKSALPAQSDDRPVPVGIFEDESPGPERFIVGVGDDDGGACPSGE